MPDEAFNEIQLSGKQLVFLFMAGAVVLVVVFLLGVMVGRGVHDATAGPATSVADAAPAPADVPPGTPAPGPTTTTPADSDYYKMLTGDSTKAVEPPQAPPEVPQTTDPATPPARGATAPAPLPVVPANKPPDKPAAPKPAPPPKAAVAGNYFVQAAALPTKDSADRAVDQLKAKGFDAFVFNAPAGGKLPFKVRIGPFPDSATASQSKARLVKEGYTTAFITKG